MPYRTLERERFYLDMLSDSIRAIAYWSDVDNVERTNDKYGFAVAYDLTETGEGDAPVKRGRVTLATIAKGWQRLIKLETAGKFHHCKSDRSVRHNEQELAKGEWGDVNYDSCVIDAVIQLATLGEIRYS